MNGIWTVLILLSMGLLIFSNPSAIVSNFAVAGESAITLALTLCAIYAVWMGLINIMKESGILNWLSQVLSIVTRKLFPSVSDETLQLITLNISANLIGVGNAATPSAIAAIKSMDNGNPRASRPMIMLFVINATSLQILPTTVIGLRTAAHSANATDIVLPAFIISVTMTVLGVILVSLLCKSKKSKVNK